MSVTLSYVSQLRYLIPFYVEILLGVGVLFYLVYFVGDQTITTIKSSELGNFDLASFGTLDRSADLTQSSSDDDLGLKLIKYGFPEMLGLCCLFIFLNFAIKQRRRVNLLILIKLN